jgi:ornithine carbamoyltransferase
MNARHFLSISNIGQETITHLVERALDFANGNRSGAYPLKGKIVGIYFKKTSTRTRTSFTVGAIKLGGTVVQYGPNDLQLVTGESISDTARVLSEYLDFLVVRTNESIGDMVEFTMQEKMSVINAMSENEHPTQAVADLTTLREAFGRLTDIHVLYVGEGNNTAAALALSICQIRGMALTLVTPEGYGLSNDLMSLAQESAKVNGALIEQHHGLERLPKHVDAVYATRWQTMGVPKADLDWREKFDPFCVTKEMMAEVSKPKGTIFMHDLPAIRGVDVVDEVIDGPQSVAFRQAHHKLSSAMAVLEWCAS